MYTPFIPNQAQPLPIQITDEVKTAIAQCAAGFPKPARARVMLALSQSADAGGSLITSVTLESTATERNVATKRVLAQWSRFTGRDGKVACLAEAWLSSCESIALSKPEHPVQAPFSYLPTSSDNCETQPDEETSVDPATFEG